MKAHLIISEKSDNTESVFSLLKDHLMTGCKSYEDKTSTFESYEAVDFDKQIYNIDKHIQILHNFPSDLVSALKPVDFYRIVLTNSNEFKSMFNGSNNDYIVYQIPNNDDLEKEDQLSDMEFFEVTALLAEMLYHQVNYSLTLRNAWTWEHKKGLLDYYHDKIAKNAAILSDYRKVLNPCESQELHSELNTI